jgi:pyruvate formate lyase activating enzyme
MQKFRWNGFSLVDAPNSAAVVYTKGCNLTCDFCYNIDLLDMNENENDLNDIDILKKIANLEKVNERTGKKYTIVNWLIITGGEPFLTNIRTLQQFLYKAKLINLKTGIYTNGYFSKLLNELIEVLDYVHIDFKDDDSFKNIQKSIELSYDFYKKKHLKYFIINTTILKSVHSIEHLQNMKDKLKKFNPKIMLQKDLKNQKFVWTLTPFYNNNDKIQTLGNLSSINESFSDSELQNILNSIS